MIRIGVLVLGITSLVLGSCIKHEVIPPPVPSVDLNAHFYGVINGAETELTENVLGYANDSEKAKIILPPPSFSSAVYYSEMSSAQVATSIKVGVGSVSWDASLSTDPGLTSFNSFFQANANPGYSDNGASGFEVTYRDGFGAVWKSSENSVNVQNVQFSDIVQESDSTGDYSLFTCNFNCYAYSFDQSDSIKIEDALYEGWFKR
ncbi:MAG: hypothetical protein JKY09_00240 [Crocinitomicaceae bacterium]|nr:hypothetical protein [Crocinitomicaceae bacterium]